MTGPEHYTEGERLLAESQLPAAEGGPSGVADADVMIAQAHAHFAAARISLDVAKWHNPKPAPLGASRWREATS